MKDLNKTHWKITLHNYLTFETKPNFDVVQGQGRAESICDSRDRKL